MNELFHRFLRHPLQVGACCPSSRGLCRELVCDIGLETAGVVVELGPGTGVVTGEIMARMAPQGRLLAVELDRTMAGRLRERFPGVVICCDSAANLPALLQQQNLSGADAVVSGLPWALFPEELQSAILDGVLESLVPGGWFVTFAYIQGMALPAGKRFRRLLRSRFSEVSTSRVVWCNLPPAFVYRCRG